METHEVVERLVYTVDEAASALCLSRAGIYELIRSEQVRSIKVGRRRLVPVNALREYIDAAMGGAA
jgi:excisionase family DNA binding protein